jgi:hypothetical protein
MQNVARGISQMYDIFPIALRNYFFRYLSGFDALVQLSTCVNSPRCETRGSCTSISSSCQVPICLDLPRKIQIYIFCHDQIISSTSFYSQRCPRLDDKKYGHLTCNLLFTDAIVTSAGASGDCLLCQNLDFTFTPFSSLLGISPSHV